MKIGIGIAFAVALFIGGVALLLLQLWLDLLDAGLFWKLQITLGALLVIVLVVTYAIKEYKEYRSITKGD